MPLSLPTLSDGLKSLEPTADVAVAANRLASAWTTYFMGASVAGVPVAGSLDAAKGAMVGALLGMAVPGASAVAIGAGVAAFWGVVIPLGASFWIVPPGVVTLAVPPPGIAAIPAGLTALFLANTLGALSKDDAAAAMAGILHASGGIGGIATVVTAGVPAPVPIL